MYAPACEPRPHFHAAPTHTNPPLQSTASPALSIPPPKSTAPAASTAPAEAPYNSTAARTPAPAASPSPAAKATAVIKRIVDKYICSIVGTFASMALAFCPIVCLAFTDNIEETISFWNVKGTEIGLANNIVSLLYTITMLPREQSFSDVLANSWCASSSLAFLLFLYARRGLYGRMWVVSTSTDLSMLVALTLLQIELSSHASELLEYLIGFGGISIVFWNHYTQLDDLYLATGEKELFSALIAVVPGINAFLSHSQQFFIVATCALNLVAYPLQLILIFKLHVTIKQKAGQLLNRLGTNLKQGNLSFKGLELQNIQDLDSGARGEDSTKHEESEEGRLFDVHEIAEVLKDTTKAIAKGKISSKPAMAPEQLEIDTTHDSLAPATPRGNEEQTNNTDEADD